MAWKKEVYASYISIEMKAKQQETKKQNNRKVVRKTEKQDSRARQREHEEFPRRRNKQTRGEKNNIRKEIKYKI